MKVKITKTLAKTLNKEIKDFDIEYVEMNFNQYKAFVNYRPFENEEDYDYAKDKFKVFRVIYPDEYYACNQYITSKDLKRIFNYCSDNKLKTFVNELRNEYAV